METLSLFILGNFGLAMIISRAKIFKRFREWVTLKSIFLGELISCIECLAVWTALPIYWITYKGFSVDVILFAFVGSATSYLLNKIK